MRFLVAFLPRKTVANIGARIAGSVTVLAWAFFFLAPRFPIFRGEGGYVAVLLPYPIMFLGWMVAGVVVTEFGFDSRLPAHQTAFRILAFALSVILNVFLVWSLLTFLTKAIKRINTRHQ